MTGEGSYGSVWTPKNYQIIKFEMFTKPSKRGPHNLILSASCTELKGEQL